MSSYMKITSSAVNGAPSDHFAPSLKKMVMLWSSAACSKPLGEISLDLQAVESEAPQVAAALGLFLQVAPRSIVGSVHVDRTAVPATDSIGSSSAGSKGSRSSTGGSSPAATISLSTGASRYWPIGTAICSLSLDSSPDGLAQAASDATRKSPVTSAIVLVMVIPPWRSPRRWLRDQPEPAPAICSGNPMSAMANRQCSQGKQREATR